MNSMPGVALPLLCLLPLGSGPAEAAIPQPAVQDRPLGIRSWGSEAQWIPATKGRPALYRLSDPVSNKWRPWRRTDDQVHLRSASFAPENPAAVPEQLQAEPGNRLYWLHFVLPCQPSWRRQLQALGGREIRHLPEQAGLWHLPEGTVEAVRGMPWVNGLGAFHPAYKLSPDMAHWLAGTQEVQARSYDLCTARRGKHSGPLLLAALKALGVQHAWLPSPSGWRVSARLSPHQLRSILHHPEVVAAFAYVDDPSLAGPGSPLSPAEMGPMNQVRLLFGADQLHELGFRGQGVRGEVMDSGLDADHREWNSRSFPGRPDPLAHWQFTSSSNPVELRHGTQLFGSVFSRGVAKEGNDAKAMGLLPDGHGVFAIAKPFQFNPPGDRYLHFQELLDPFEVVFQSNSWDGGGVDCFGSFASAYNSMTREIDDLVWLYDLPVTWAMGNSGANRQGGMSQAWGKTSSAWERFTTATIGISRTITGTLTRPIPFIPWRRL